MNSVTTKKLTGMTLEEARSVIWPFRELKGHTFGSLWDKGLLSSQDMNYAMQRAYDPQVREAARIILLQALSEAKVAAETGPGPLNVVSTKLRSFAERRQFQLAMIEGSLLGFVLGAALIFMISAIWRLSNKPTTSSGEQALDTITSSTTGIIILVVVLALYVAIPIAIVYAGGKLLDFLVFNRLEKQIRLHRKGQLGEERVLNVMYSALDGRWWLFRNLELPGRRIGDLDLVLVGPHGMYSFEVKAYSGEYRNVGERWEKRLGTKWHTIRKSPTVQARRNAAELSQLLSTNQIKQWVNSVIIWANPESTVAVDNPSTPVWTLDQLSGCLKDLCSERPIPEGQVEKIVDVLKKICQDVDAELDS